MQQQRFIDKSNSAQHVMGNKSRFYFWVLWLIFHFFGSHFPVITVGLDLFSGAYLKKFVASVVPSVWECLDQRASTSLDVSLPGDRNVACFWSFLLLSTIIWWAKLKNRRRKNQQMTQVQMFNENDERYQLDATIMIYYHK